MSFNNHYFGYLCVFSCLISGFTQRSVDKTKAVFAIFLYLLKLALCSNMWFVIYQVEMAPVNNAISLVLGWNNLQMSVSSLMSFHSMFICFSSGWFVCWWEVGIEVIYYCCLGFHLWLYAWYYSLCEIGYASVQPDYICL